MRGRVLTGSLCVLALTATLSTRAEAAEKLLAAFHIDVDMGTFVMSDERALGRDVASGPLNYFDPYFNMWITGGVQFRPHPLVALDLESGIARWTGVATDWSSSAIAWWTLKRVFRVRNYLIPVELSVTITLRDSPKNFIGICVGPGLYFVQRFVKIPEHSNSFARAVGGGGKLTLVVGTPRSGPFEFNFEIGFRITRFAKLKTKDDVIVGGLRPDFSGPYAGFKLMFGGGTSDPAPAEPPPEPAPAPQPQPVSQPQPVAPIPPSGG